MEYQAQIGENKILVEKKDSAFLLDGNESKFQVEKNGDHYLVYSETKVSTVRVISKSTDSLTLEVNGKSISVQVKDHIALMLEKLGIDNTQESVINEVKAPMPGVILEIIAQPNQEIKKGDPLLILEAMKMENMIKSPTDATIKSIGVDKGQSVEKNETLITFE